MTGYGKGNFTYQGLLYLVEIHSVNRKHLDINTVFSKELLPLDVTIRRWISTKVKRGQVTCRISRDVSEDLESGKFYDTSFAKSVKLNLETLAKDIGLKDHTLTFGLILDQMEKMPKSKGKDLDEFKACLKKGFDEALEGLLQMRSREGAELKADIESHLKKMKEMVPFVEKELKNYPKDYEHKLLQKLEEYNVVDHESKERLLREVILFVDKVDLSEELSRIQAHIKHFEELLDSSMDSVGKNLDFITQELNREANTMASKSQSLKITELALKMKSYIEKVREQVQNID